MHRVGLFSLGRQTTRQFNRLMSNLPAIAPKTSSALPPDFFAPNFRVETLSKDHPIVKRLFKPYIPADFDHPKGEEDLKWLHHHAYLFGLHPVKDMKLPDLAPEKVMPLDARYAASLKYAEDVRSRKQQRQLDTELRKRRKLLAKKLRINLVDDARTIRDELEQLKTTGKVINEDDDSYEEEESQDKKKYLPLRLRSLEEQEAYREQKRVTIAQLMTGMDERIREHRERRRAFRKQQRDALKKI